MASTIAAVTTSGGGVVTTADASGNLNLLAGTTTVVALTTAGAAVTGTLSATGITTVAAGSAALPAIVSTTGTADTGFWFPAADTVAASTAGAEAMRIDSSGNVGIGTTSPAVKLHVYSTASDGANMRLQSTGGSIVAKMINNDNGYKAWVGNDGTNDQWAVGQWGLTGANLGFYTGSGLTERMRINSSGNVGIGTTSPNYLFNAGATNAVTSLAGAGVTLFTTGALTSSIGGVLNFRPSIGTTASDIFNLSICAYDHSGDTNADGLSINGSDGVSFCTGSNSRQERMRIDSSGNVGIGTSSPTQKITIAGGLNFSSAITFTGAGYEIGKDGANFLTSSGGSAGTRFIDASTAVEWMRIDSSGNLCVGRSSVGVGDRFVVQTIASGTIMLGYNSSATNTYQILDTGNVRNTNNSYGAISDAKLKENVADATPKLEKLTQVRIVNFNRIDDEQKQIGVIAQELELIFPGMVEESPDYDVQGNDLGTTTKSVKYSVFVPMLIKAMQEQQSIITALTTRITALEAKA